MNNATCPSCGAVVHKDFVICLNCGLNFVTGELVKSKPQTGAKGSFVNYSSQCDQSRPHDNTFICPECRSEFATSEEHLDKPVTCPNCGKEIRLHRKIGLKTRPSDPVPAVVLTDVVHHNPNPDGSAVQQEEQSVYTPDSSVSDAIQGGVVSALTVFFALYFAGKLYFSDADALGPLMLVGPLLAGFLGGWVGSSHGLARVLLLDAVLAGAFLMYGKRVNHKSYISDSPTMQTNLPAPAVAVVNGELQLQKLIGRTAESAQIEAMREKLKRITLPELRFEEAGLTPIIDFLEGESRKHDPKGEGVNFVLHSSLAKRVTLSLRNISLGGAVKYTAMLSGLQVRLDGDAIVLFSSKQGELPVQNLIDLPSEPAQIEVMREKLKRIIVQDISFEEANITQVVGFLSDESRKLDPKGEGVNIVAAACKGAKPITIALRNVALFDALMYITTLSDTQFRIDSDAIVIQDIGFSRAANSAVGETSSYRNNSLSEVAKLTIDSKAPYTIGTAAVGAKLFSNRSFTFSELPEFLVGKPYLIRRVDHGKQTSHNGLQGEISANRQFEMYVAIKPHDIETIQMMRQVSGWILVPGKFVTTTFANQPWDWFIFKTTVQAGPIHFCPLGRYFTIEDRPFPTSDSGNEHFIFFFDGAVEQASKSMSVSAGGNPEVLKWGVLGKSSSDVASTFGEPQPKEIDALTGLQVWAYHKDNKEFVVQYADGTAAVVVYKNLTGNDIDRLLQANANGNRWEKSDSSSPNWLRSDGNARALYSNSALAVGSATWWDMYEAKRQQQKQQTAQNDIIERGVRKSPPDVDAAYAYLVPRSQRIVQSWIRMGKIIDAKFLDRVGGMQVANDHPVVDCNFKIGYEFTFRTQAGLIRTHTGCLWWNHYRKTREWGLNEMMSEQSIDGQPIF